MLLLRQVVQDRLQLAMVQAQRVQTQRLARLQALRGLAQQQELARVQTWVAYQLVQAQQHTRGGLEGEVWQSPAHGVAVPETRAAQRGVVDPQQPLQQPGQRCR